MFGARVKREKLQGTPLSAKTEKLLRGLHQRWRRPTLTTEQEGGVEGGGRDTGCCVDGHRCVLVRPHFPPLDRRQCSFPVVVQEVGE